MIITPKILSLLELTSARRLMINIGDRPLNLPIIPFIISNICSKQQYKFYRELRIV